MLCDCQGARTLVRQIASAGEDRMIVFGALAMCCWPSMFGIGPVSQSCMRAARS
jgi:hypothetical protein